jgi:hypothetical protein
MSAIRASTIVPHATARRSPDAARPLGLAVAAALLIACGVSARAIGAESAEASSVERLQLTAAAILPGGDAPVPSPRTHGEVVAPEARDVPAVRANASPRNRAVDVPTPRARAGAGTGARVVLRCWQEGALIVEELGLLPPAEPFPYLVKFPSREPGGLPTYLTETRNATCVVRAVGAEATTGGADRPGSARGRGAP